MKLRLLGLDPGTNNFGFGVIETNKSSFEILDAGTLNNTIKDLTTCVHTQYELYIEEISDIIKNYDIDFAIGERYQNRGFRRGSAGEGIGLMLGCVFPLVMNVTLITAAQWKNVINRKIPLEDLYKFSDTNHELDAIMVALYGNHYYTKTKPFEIKNIKSKIKRFYGY